MKAGSHSMPEARPEASAAIQLVQIEVSPTHPLLLLKRALPWEVITEVMTRYWRQNGTEVAFGVAEMGHCQLISSGRFHQMGPC